jgi:WhiB family redox-sensing transcriptional regulator
MNLGNCKNLAWEIFFPGNGTGLSAAQKICAECPVSQECLEYALQYHIEHGVWGGCSERERGRILRRRRSRQAVTIS